MTKCSPSVACNLESATAARSVRVPWLRASATTSSMSFASARLAAIAARKLPRAQRGYACESGSSSRAAALAGRPDGCCGHSNLLSSAPIRAKAAHARFTLFRNPNFAGSNCRDRKYSFSLLASAAWSSTASAPPRGHASARPAEVSARWSATRPADTVAQRMNRSDKTNHGLMTTAATSSATRIRHNSTEGAKALKLPQAAARAPSALLDVPLPRSSCLFGDGTQARAPRRPSRDRGVGCDQDRWDSAHDRRELPRTLRNPARRRRCTRAARFGRTGTSRSSRSSRGAARGNSRR